MTCCKIPEVEAKAQKPYDYWNIKTLPVEWVNSKSDFHKNQFENVVQQKGSEGCISCSVNSKFGDKPDV